MQNEEKKFKWAGIPMTEEEKQTADQVWIEMEEAFNFLEVFDECENKKSDNRVRKVSKRKI